MSEINNNPINLPRTPTPGPLAYPGKKRAVPRTDLYSLNDGKLSEIRPTTADVNNSVPVADKTEPKLKENTDTVVMGGATNKPPQVIRRKSELALADVAWSKAINNDATIVREQSKGIGDGVGFDFDGSQINGSLEGVSFKLVGDKKKQQALSRGLGNLVT